MNWTEALEEAPEHPVAGYAGTRKVRQVINIAETKDGTRETVISENGRANGIYSLYSELLSEDPTKASNAGRLSAQTSSENPTKEIHDILNAWGIPAHDWIAVTGYANADRNAALIQARLGEQLTNVKPVANLYTIYLEKVTAWTFIETMTNAGRSGYTSQRLEQARNEYEHARSEGVKFLWHVQPTGVRGGKAVDGLELIKLELTDDGSIVPQSGSEFLLEADLIVLCSSDPEYLPLAQEVCRRATVPVIVAGNPKDQVDALTAAGVQGFVHVMSDAVETLTGWQNRLGMKE